MVGAIGTRGREVKSCGALGGSEERKEANRKLWRKWQNNIKEIEWRAWREFVWLKLGASGWLL